MKNEPPIAEKWTFRIRFAFQKAGFVPDLEFLCNAALIGIHVGPLAYRRAVRTVGPHCEWK
jgi:hypothetical protein